MKTILVPMLGGKNDLTALEAANAVARLFDSHIEALHVRPNAVQQGITMTLGAGPQANNFWDEVEKEIKENRNAAHRNLESFRDRAHLPLVQTPTFVRGVTAGWSEAEGMLVETMAYMSRYHDLTVVPRAEAHYGFLPSEVGDLLMQSGRPVLLVPPRLPSLDLETVCVAWKDTSEAAHVITAAMPLLEKASKVILVGVVEKGSKEPIIAALNNIGTSLRWRSIEPQLSCLTTNLQNTTLAIKDFLHQVRADLLVMGGYGHSRAREYLFGGMTWEMLVGADIPVFLAR